MLTVNGKPAQYKEGTVLAQIMQNWSDYTVEREEFSIILNGRIVTVDYGKVKLRDGDVIKIIPLLFGG